MTPLARVLVLTGVVTLIDVQGGVIGQANHVLATETGKASIDAAVTANSSFAVDLYQRLTKQKENLGKNLFFSPYSLSAALAMTAEGASGETAGEMGKVLRFPEAARRIGADAQLIPWNTTMIHTGMAELNERLNSSNSGDHYEIRVANALWGEKTYPFRQSYVDSIHEFYKTGGVFSVDFLTNSEGTRQQINNWTAERTKGRIQDVVSRNDISSDTRLVLANAIFFKGEWASKFKSVQTRNGGFTLVNGSKESVPMMSQERVSTTSYAAFNADGSFFNTPRYLFGKEKEDQLYPGEGGFTMLEMPYKGNELAWVAVMPRKAGGLRDIDKKLTAENLRKWMTKLESRPVNAALPKLRLQRSYSLDETLKSLGMRRAFANPGIEREGAQFDGMCASEDPRQKLYITAVLHKAFLEVNEEGSEAAAASAVIMVPAAPAGGGGGGGGGELRLFIPDFRADKPFIFLIRDVKTSTILFLGRMMNPKA